MFQFTHPGRGATVVRDTPHILQHVSIHAPREGCDTFPRASRRGWRSFNSRTPGGVRLPCLVRELNPGEFQFTHPGRGATKRATTQVVKVRFQFTHPGRGATGSSRMSSLWRLWFQFTHPGRGATLGYFGQKSANAVSIHAPREGCDFQLAEKICESAVSIHAPREGCDATFVNVRYTDKRVSIHAPREGCDDRALPIISNVHMFQFTHPGRGATALTLILTNYDTGFNSRTPGGVRQCGAKLRIMGRINKRNLRLEVLL